MESPAHRRLTAAEGRKFAFTLGMGFAALAALFLWRGRATVSLLLSSVATLSGVLGIAMPTRLGPVSRGWAAFGAALSRITSPVFFTLIYMVVVTPIGLVRRTFGRSPMVRDPRAPSFWIRRPDTTEADGRAQLERQF